MSMLASSPTEVSVPDKFREEVSGKTPADLQCLHDSVARQSAQRVDPAEITAGIAKLGWTAGFAQWYSDQVFRQGPYLELSVPRVPYEVAEQMVSDASQAKSARSITQQGIAAAVYLVIAIAGLAVFGSSLGQGAIALMAAAVVAFGAYLYFAITGRDPHIR